VANSNTKQDQISKFLKKLWKVNAVSGRRFLDSMSCNVVPTQDQLLI